MFGYFIVFLINILMTVSSFLLDVAFESGISDLSDLSGISIISDFRDYSEFYNYFFALMNYVILKLSFFSGGLIVIPFLTLISL